MNIYQILPECHTIEDVVDLLNTNGSRIAAQYAYQAAEEAGYGINSENLEPHLDALVEVGAKFDYNKALKEALSIDMDCQDQ